MIIRRAKRESSVVDWMERVSDNQYSADVIISTVLFPSYFSLNFVALPDHRVRMTGNPEIVPR